MKMTLLEMVQNILSAMDSDEVNDISDTIESAQVAEIIKETFFEQFNNITFSTQRRLIKLDAVNDLDSPNYLKYGADVDNIHWVKYKNEDFGLMSYETIVYRTPEEFLDEVLMYKAATDNVTLTTDPSSGVQYYIKNNQQPKYYTSFDNNYLAFDSYNVAYDTTLQQNKVMAFGTVLPIFTMTNGFIPPLPDDLFPLLLAESKSVAFINLKQITSSKEEQRARRQRIRMQNDQFKSKEQQRRHIADAPNYARVPR